MKKILTILAVAPSLLLSLFGGLLKLVNEGIKPITDETATNKDNIIQEKVSRYITIAITWVGKLQTLLNYFNKEEK